MKTPEGKLMTYVITRTILLFLLYFGAKVYDIETSKFSGGVKF